MMKQKKMMMQQDSSRGAGVQMMMQQEKPCKPLYYIYNVREQGLQFIAIFEAL